MKKIKPFPYLIPKPVAIVGALVEGKPNFLTIADISTTGYKVPRFVVSSGKPHYTNKGIIENESFSVNIPSEDMVALTDYFGMVSGSQVDKSTNVEIFYGVELKTAPMIKTAPITHACKLIKTLDFGDTHYLFIGDIVETYVNEDYFSNKLPDIEKVKPFTFYYDNFYRNAGAKIAQAYNIGRSLKKN
jgi:flavin reductase (DIM6/NTAB) family NADH-FMN oxidoreductase RutF